MSRLLLVVFVFLIPGCGKPPGPVPSTEEVMAACDPQLELLTEDCRACVVEQCRGELAPCCAATGCVALVECSTRTQCEHAACYDARTCKTQVDAAGGFTGEGTANGGDLGACVEAAAKNDAHCAACRPL